MDMYCCPMASTRVPTGSTEGPIGVFCNGSPVAMGGMHCRNYGLHWRPNGPQYYP